MRGERFGSVARATLVRELVLSMSFNEDTRGIRTIHSCKGAEFKSVIVFLDDEKDLRHITQPDIENIEECRVLYVALS